MLVMAMSHQRNGICRCHPLVEKLERCANFKPQTPLRNIIRLTEV